MDSNWIAAMILASGVAVSSEFNPEEEAPDQGELPLPKSLTLLPAATPMTAASALFTQ
jgi:hypothetical protein